MKHDCDKTNAGFYAYVVAVQFVLDDHVGVGIVTVATAPQLSHNVVDNSCSDHVSLCGLERFQAFLELDLVDWLAAIAYIQVCRQKDLNLFHDTDRIAAVRVEHTLQSYKYICDIP